MKTNKLFIAMLMSLISTVTSAQIGYQVSLLNSATGEPRVAETVNVEVTLSNSQGGIICTEKKSETTNDFGILSLVIGNQNTFADVDWTKLPFFVSVSVDGKLVGKTQILTVPVAEYAKKTGVLTKEKLEGTWPDCGGSGTITFSLEGNCISTHNYVRKYTIDGNNVYIYDPKNNYHSYWYQYVAEEDILLHDTYDGYIRIK